MSFHKHTLKDIAKALNLSTSTVSRALRDSYEISDKTKKKVIQYARKINFQVNPIARNLKERKSNTIGVVVSEISNNFFSQVIEGIESVAYEKNYQVVITQSHESAVREKRIVEHLFNRSVDGLLMTLTASEKEAYYLKELVTSGFPIVFFDRVPEGYMTKKVIANNVQGAVDAVNFLVKNNCRRIVHLTGAKHLSTNKDRLEGFKQGLELNGLDYKSNDIKYCESAGTDLDEVMALIKELKDYDGIFISGDRLTTGYLQVINRFSDYKTHKIIGFTNSKVVDIFNPPITAIRQPAIEMGACAAKLLIAQIESKYPVEEFETITLPVELIDI